MLRKIEQSSPAHTTSILLLFVILIHAFPTGKFPGRGGIPAAGELKDMVCSPGGTTIQAVKVLEEKGLRAAVMDAMDACIEKSKCMWYTCGSTSE